MFGSAEKKLSTPLIHRGLLLARVAEVSWSGLYLRGSDAEKLAFYESAEQVANKESAFQQSW